MAPLDRIKQALKDEEQRARFDRALDRLAGLMVEALTSGIDAAPEFVPRIHDRVLVEVGINVRRTIR